jgi:hypothetical protein
MMVAVHDENIYLGKEEIYLEIIPCLNSSAVPPLNQLFPGKPCCMELTIEVLSWLNYIPWKASRECP